MENFLASEFPPAAPEKARFHIIPVPFEKSTSYGSGTKNGPAAILAASQQLEKIQRGKKPGALGIFTASEIPSEGKDEATIGLIEEAIRKALRAHALPFMLGGEHTVTLGAARALTGFLGRDWGLVQFDAHCDLRQAYEDNPLSHASVMRRVFELGIPLAQFGTRSYCEEEADFRKENSRKIFGYDADWLSKNVPTGLPEDFPKKIYLSFDIDALDSSIMPATGTPVPGGLLWYQTLELLEKICKGREIIGCDLVEFAPIKGFHAYDFTAATLCYELMALAAPECD